MSEKDAIARAPGPRTRQSLASDLHDLGIEAGMTVLVHSSLSALGWVVGGPVAVVQALMDVLTPEGTLVMPTHSTDNSDPAGWQNPPVPPEWWPIIRDTMPGYDPRISPTRGMGRIVDTFRTWPGTRRSAHPSTSFAAWGKHAATMVENHAIDYGMGETSPLARVYDHSGWVLLLGVGYGNNTSFHLAEYRVPCRTEIELGAAVLDDGRRVWRAYRDIDLDESDFPEIGAELERTHPVTRGSVGSAETRLFPQRPAVDFAVEWMTRSARRNAKTATPKDTDARQGGRRSSSLSP